MAKKPQPKPINWEDIKQAYNAEYAANGDVDLQALAEKFGVAYGTIRNKVSNDAWRAGAQPLRDQVLRETREQVVPMLVKHRVDVIDSHLTFLGKLRASALNHLAKEAQGNKLTINQSMKIVFDSLRAEKMLHELVGDAPPRDGSEDEQTAALFTSFMKRMEAEAAANGPAPAPLPSLEATGKPH